ncbi:maestro heat-like repeat family member 5 [Podarcis lilfordi]|uniref:Maestro heat-like repeat family member 5 n=1 Tax=Podarcis lilfordi TaxID=74358 RepID=A0AA35JTT0_9SAUR|nr:maestro heat-like repeat family member 5 [Podarcis lilfordi]
MSPGAWGPLATLVHSDLHRELCISIPSVIDFHLDLPVHRLELCGTRFARSAPAHRCLVLLLGSAQLAPRIRMTFFLKRKKKNKIYPSYEDEAPVLLPALAKPSTSATEDRRKNQVAPKNKIYPSYEDEAPVLLPALAKPTPSAAEARAAEARPLVLPGLAQPRTSKQDPSQQRPSKKKSLEDSGPAFPELSDENFEYLWMGKKMLGGRTIREALEMMDEREILDTILQHLQPAPQKTSKPEHNKNALYRYYGLKLRDSRSAETVHLYLHLLLRLPLEEEADREGISEAIGVASSTHISQVLMAVRDFGRAAIARKTETSENTSETNASITVILCCGQMAFGARQDELPFFIDLITEELLFQFQNSRKNEALKKSFMKAATLTTKALVQSIAGYVTFPHKEELTFCIIEVIKEEPMASLTILHQAMETIIRMTNTEPGLLSRDHLHLAQHAHQLAVGGPSLETLQEILVHTNGWIDSTKISERQRAVKTTNVLMKYVSEHLDFDVSQDFPLLGQLVALLSIHLTDNVKEIGLQSAEALYHLHYIMIAKMGKELEKRRNKNKKGNMVRWVREDFFIPGPSLFHYNIAKVAKAFGEHLTPSQINEVVLKAIDNLIVEDRAVSQAAGKLLRSFLEECGMEMEDLPMVVKEIYNHLHQIPDTRTKEVTLSAIVSLATKRLQPVVDSLLDCSMECDESAAVIWKALVADPYSSVKLLRPLLKRLQDEDPKAEVPSRRCSTSQMPMAATNALCHILSFPEAAGILKSKFHHLLFALSTQICFVHEARRRGSRATSLIPEPSSHLDPLTIAVQALKQLIGRVEYLDDFEVLELQSCWDMLSSPESFFQGIRLLARTLFTSSKEQYKRIARLARKYMCCPSNKKRAIGMAFYLEKINVYIIKDALTVALLQLRDVRLRYGHVRDLARKLLQAAIIQATKSLNGRDFSSFKPHLMLFMSQVQTLCSSDPAYDVFASA